MMHRTLRDELGVRMCVQDACESRRVHGAQGLAPSTVRIRRRLPADSVSHCICFVCALSLYSALHTHSFPMAEEMDSANIDIDQPTDEDLYNEGRDNIVKMRESLSEIQDAKTMEAWARAFSAELVRNDSFDHY